MSKRRPKQPRDYKVGYGRPPDHSKFKPGKCGNPNGRPKGTKNRQTIVREILRRKMPVEDEGRLRMITVEEGILLGFAKVALKANRKAAEFLFATEAGASPDDNNDDPTPDEQEILNDYVLQLAAKLKEGK
jgi:hypothetical protein